MSSNRTARITLVFTLALAVTSCGESVRGPLEPAGAATVPDPRGLGASYSLLGSTLGLVDLVVEDVIGPLGGVLHLGGGHSITFPLGALQTLTPIRAEVDQETLEVRFEPHGLEFPSWARPTLAFDYSAAVGVTDAASLAIIYLDGSGALEEIIGGEVDAEADEVRARIDHFSTYALATD